MDNYRHGDILKSVKYVDLIYFITFAYEKHILI